METVTSAWRTAKVVEMTLQTARERKELELVRQLADTGEELSYHAHSLRACNDSHTLSQQGRLRHLLEIDELVNSCLVPTLSRLREVHAKLPNWNSCIDTAMQAGRDLATDAHFAVLANKALSPPAARSTRTALVARAAHQADTLVRIASAAAKRMESDLRAAEAA